MAFSMRFSNTCNLEGFASKLARNNASTGVIHSSSFHTVLLIQLISMARFPHVRSYGAEVVRGAGNAGQQWYREIWGSEGAGVWSIFVDSDLPFFRG